MFIAKIIENNTMYTMQELNLCLFSDEVFSSDLVSSIFSVHSSTSFPTNPFVHLQIE